MNLRNSATRWVLSEEYITMHGPMNVKQFYVFILQYFTQALPRKNRTRSERLVVSRKY